MRYDMNKVLIERPRHGGKGGQRGTYDKASLPREKRVFKGRDVDLRPKRESMRRKHIVNGDQKYFSDLITPMERFLISRVGQPWDDVWSEICKVMKGNSLQADHVKGHFKQMVGGIPHSGECSFDDSDWFADNRKYRNAVYVDEKGIVRKSKPYPAHKKRRYHYFRESDTVEYHKLNGCWFRVEIDSEEKSSTYKGFYDYYTRMETCYYVVSKRALSRKEAKKLDLANKVETRAPKLTLG